MNYPQARLRRLVTSVDNGSWGADPTEEGRGIPCIRAADFDFSHFRVDMSRAPLRAIDDRSARRLKLASGDLVLEKSGGGEGVPVGRVVLFDHDVDAVTSNFAARVRLTEAAEPRFMTYVLAAQYFAGATLRCIKQTTGIQNLDTNEWLNSAVPCPSREAQGRIADFLDDRVSRIDSIVAARRRQIEALTELESGACLDALERRGLARPTSVESGWKEGPGDNTFRITTLGRVLRQLTNGYVGPTRDVLVDSGVRYIQSVHIKNGTIEFGRRPFFVPIEWHDARPRTSLRAKDILIVQTGDIGRVAIVPEGFGRANCHALLIARTNEQAISPEYLFEILRSDFGYQAMLARATGALHPHLESSVRGTPVPVPQRSAQDEIADEIRRRRSDIAASVASFDRSIQLLAEFKQSLIFAAVTGDFDVTTASKRVPA